MSPVRKSLFSTWANQNHWPHAECELLNALQCLSRSGWPCAQYVSYSPEFVHISTTDEIGWTMSAVCELLFSVWAAQNHWWEWINICPACELLSSLRTDKNHWQKWLDLCPGCEFLSSVWADQNYWYEMLDTHLACESFFNVWAYWNHWQDACSLWVTLQYFSRSEPQTKMAEHALRPVCELLFSIWADHNHWKNDWTWNSEWVALWCLNKLEPLTRMAEPISRLWVALRSLRELKSLTRMAEHHHDIYSKWVALQCLSISRPLTRMSQYAFRTWASLQFFLSFSKWENWHKWLNISSGWALLQYLSKLKPLTGMHYASECEFFSQIRTSTDRNCWTCIQDVSHTSVLDTVTDKNLMSSLWVTIQCLSRSKHLMWRPEHTYSEWVTLQF